MSKQFTLGKQERLKSRKQTELLFAEGKKFTLHPFRIFYTIEKSGQAGLVFGTGVSSRQFKKATDRNRVKRLIREAYRLQKNPLQEKVKAKGDRLTIFFIYTGKELPLYDEIFDKTAKVLEKISRLIITTT